MSVKLLLNPAADSRKCLHPDTGINFYIRPISPEQYEEIRRKSLSKERTLETPKWGANFAVAAIAAWGPQSSDDENQNTVGDANGAAECNEANLRIFGRNQAINIMPWIIDQACSLDQFRIEEEAAAKNV
jgi:hypothetical protein